MSLLKNSDPNADWLVGSGEMFDRIRAKDWSETPVGPRNQWSTSLRSALNMMLSSRYPMFIWWGSELTNFYNDAYIPCLGSRHPDSLGRPAAKIWAEIWDVVGRQSDLVLQSGQSTWSERLLLVMQRYGFIEETYFTYSYSPIRYDDGSIAGIFGVCFEETERILGERRLKTLKELAANTANSTTVQEACDNVIRSLTNNYDLPFTTIYLSSEEKDKIRKICGSEPFGLPNEVNIQEDVEKDAILSRLCCVFKDGGSEILHNFHKEFGPHQAGVWPETITTAVVLPLTQPTDNEPIGVFFAGLSSRLAMNEQYEGFLNLLAGQISKAIADATAVEAERKRVEALAELDAAKTTFFSNISHEFRTPLTLMLGPLEDAILKQKVPETEELSLMYRNALRLLKMVNALLDFSRIEAGRMQAVFEPTDLAKFTIDLASVFRAAVEKAGIRFNIDCSQLSQPVSVDHQMWEQIVLNLISNAFKFTYEGEIKVALQEKDDHIELMVRDTGIGIPEEEIPHLFERFHRVEGARGRSLEGSGIGLALIHELVKFHDGSIKVETSHGKGSTFVVSIPAQRKHSSHISQQTSPKSYGLSSKTQAFIEEASRWFPDDQRLDSQVALMQESVTPKTQPKSRILIADDNSDMRNYLRNLLHASYEVEAVGDGQAALDAVKRKLPDLLITDVMMPGMSGFDLVHHLRSNPETQSLPILALSARAGEESRIEGLQAGVDDYIVKPFSGRELLARINSRLEVSRIRHHAEDARLKGMQQISLVTDAAPVYIANYDLNKRYKFVNKRYVERFGLKTEKIIGKYIWEVIGEESYDQIKGYLDRALMGEPVRFDFELIDRELGNRFFYASYAPEFNEAGEIIGMIGAFTDLTEHRRQERNQFFLLELSNKIREISEARELFRVVPRMVGEHLQLSRCFINEIDLKHGTATIHYDYFTGNLPSLVGTVELANYSQITKADIMAGKTILNCDTRNDPRTSALYETSYGPDQIGAYIAVPLMRNKQWVSTLWASVEFVRSWKDWEIELLETVAEKTWLAVEKLRSESKLRLQEAALRESGNRFRALVEASAQIVWMAEPEGHVVEDSPSWRKFTGQSYEGFKGWGFLNSVYPADRQEFVNQWRLAFEQQSAFNLIFRLRNSRGEWRWMGAKSVALFASDKILRGWMAMATDITARKNAEDERERLLSQEQNLRMELEKSSRIKDEFLATISHELRTPLNAILGWAHILRSTEANTNENKLAVDTIYLSATSQAQIIDDLLDVSRIISGKMTIQPEVVKLSKIISDSINIFAHAIHVKDISLNISYDAENETLDLYADPRRLQQIFWNLISNAVKFTPNGGKIDIRVMKSGSELNVVIEDSGSGINAEFLPFVFERFRQADSSTTRKFGGLGLGLSIAKHLVELHGGKITADSKGEGLGAAFTLTLPLLSQQLHSSEISKERKRNLQESSFSITALAGVHENFSLTGKKILLVEDDLLSSEMFRVALEREGLNFRAVSRSSEALSILEEWIPDIIVSDLGLPDEDGYSLIKKIRANSSAQLARVPAIALTGYGKEEGARAITAGFQLYQTKPIQPDALIAVLINLLQNPS
ncbi:MAG TPA: ATP-binding protein [Acidobacteriota bacterium]|nr:ATP-binding protein [Acidobacteriota bacterium]